MCEFGSDGSTALEKSKQKNTEVEILFAQNLPAKYETHLNPHKLC